MKTPNFSVKNNNGRCIIKFYYLGNFYSITQGDYDNAVDRERMESIALQIKADIRNGNFDGIDRYKDKPTGISKEGMIALLENNLHDVNLKGILKHLRLYKAPIRGKGELKRFFDSLPIATPTKRRYYTALRTFPEIKPFCEFEIKAPKGEAKKQIDPFTQNELRRIIEAFKNTHYKHFVMFMAYTGCRPSEAIGIRWEDIEFPNMRIRFSESLSKNQLTGKRERKATKTGKVRYTPLSEWLLGELAMMNFDHDATGLIFTTPDGCIIDDSNFLAREWKPRLKSAGVRYRSPYNLRHTFISHALQKGVDVVTVASWVGNSPKVIYEHYAGLVGDAPMPDLYS